MPIVGMSRACAAEQDRHRHRQRHWQPRKTSAPAAIAQSASLASPRLPCPVAIKLSANGTCNPYWSFMLPFVVVAVVVPVAVAAVAFCQQHLSTFEILCAVVDCA